MNVAVFCGARVPSDPDLMTLARSVGKALAQAGHRVVYGGSDCGIMGAVAQGAMGSGGAVVGIGSQDIPEECNIPGLAAFEQTANLSSRKFRILELAQAVVVLPGGIGTMDEFFEVLTLKSLRKWSGPIVLVGPEGYWSSLVGLLNEQVALGLTGKPVMEQFQVVSQPSVLIDLLSAPDAGHRLAPL